ncbi:MAG: manganese efflux pump [Ruminococcus sp.]|nr:manganese efflux pump [Ruminococcus sp.]
MLCEIILSVIVSIDIFLAAAAYECSKIRIPLASAIIINASGAFFLWLSLYFSSIIGEFIPGKIYKLLGFLILLTIGITTVFKSLIRNLVRRLEKRGELFLHTKESGIVIKLYLDDTAADVDNSKTLSPKEAAALAAAASLDSLSIGLGMGGNEINPATTAIYAIISGFLAIILGGLTGRKIASINRDFSWVGGAALILFGIFEFMQ